jgi:hypothetical protein
MSVWLIIGIVGIYTMPICTIGPLGQRIRQKQSLVNHPIRFTKGILYRPSLRKLHEASPVLDVPSLVALDFHPRSLQILVTLANASQSRIRIKGVLLKPNLRFSVCIKLLALENVQVDRESPGDEKEGQWNNHSLLSTGAISNITENSGTDTKLAKFWLIKN